MNQLETLIIPTETVEFNGQKLEVRGLGFADISFIVRQYRDITAELYGKALAGELGGSVEEIALSITHDYASVAATAIACALDAPKDSEKAAKLPMAVQTQIIEKTAMLTFADEGGLEKMMEIVVRAMVGAASLTSPKT